MVTSKIRNIAESVASGMAHSLTELLGRDVSVSFSDVFNKDLNSVSFSLSGKYVCARFKSSSIVNSSGLFLMKERDCTIISDILIGQDGSQPAEIMSELHFSAYREVVQQLLESLDNGIRNSTTNKSLELVDISLFDSSLSKSTLFLKENNLIVITFGIFIQGLLSSEIMFCIPDLVASSLFINKESEALQVLSGTNDEFILENKKKIAGGVVLENNDSVVTNRPLEGNIGLLLDVPLKMTVELGRTTKLVKEILALAPGSVVELDKLAGEAVDILINEKLIAKGEVVVIDENFGVRITEILNPEERLTAVQS